MNPRLRPRWAALVLAGLGASLAGAVEPAVPVVRKEVQPLIDKHLADQLPAVMEQLARANRPPAHFKLPVRVKAITDPWAGMADLERHGLRAAEAAKLGVEGLRALLDALSASAGKPPGVAPSLEERKEFKDLDDLAAYVVAVLDEARRLRDEALGKLSAKDRTFSFVLTGRLTRNFSNQAFLKKEIQAPLQNDRALCALAHEVFNWGKTLGSARALLYLSRPSFLAQLKKHLEAAAPLREEVPGVTGGVLYRMETKHGLILFGGKGANSYEIEGPVAFLADLGGDDVYKGVLASSFDADHPHGMVIDFAGDDTYECAEFGLATGRLGVGLLLDLAGNDTYKLAHSSGGVGLAGIGILCDVQGKDTYTGSKYTQGVGFGGIGLLCDLAGDDRHTSFGYALGLGGPGGVGAVVDRAGDDRYQCGKKYPSGYNLDDAPNAKPGDPNFQWDAWGLGMGLGRRVIDEQAKAHHPFSMAGGVGVVLDLAGNDRYDGTNFSLACGYFFGAGLVLDLGGDDTYSAARYGLASGAHYAMGLFLDYDGKDSYTSSGPTYTGGCAWDRSAFLFIDSGKQADTYRLARSNGLGRADIGSWGVFADLGGDDRYHAGGGLGQASDSSLGVFFDRAGDDDYKEARPGAKERPANRQTRADDKGGLFVDR
jgi:hypothetical protein